jgi:flavin reductase (DIM6/NTAB) family NADH-FMN oxidoreductase RutF
MKARKNPAIHKALRQIPYGLHVVGVRGKGEAMNAFVAAWVCQCSFDPPLVMVAIRRGTRSHELVKAGRVFSVNLVDRKDRDILRKLVKPAESVGDKLGKVGHVEEDTGAPILRRAFAFVECRVREIREPGDHALIIGEVVHAALRGCGDVPTCEDLGWHYGG